MPPLVLISTSSFGRISDEPLRKLESAGMEVRLNPHGRALTANEVAELLSDADGLIAGTEPLGREVLVRASQLRVVSRCGAGLDNVDQEAAAELGIAVLGTPDAPTDAVAELALAGMLSVLRGLPAADRELRAGRWNKSMGRLLRGKTVGIVGLGRIGAALARLLAPFQPRLLATDPMQNDVLARELMVEYVPFSQLISDSDVITLHLPHASQEGPLLSKDRIAELRPGAVVVNCARGGLVDETALAEALREGRLGGAYLDVFEKEPYQGPLTEIPNVLLSPHIGSYAAEARLDMENQAVDNLLGALQQARR